MTDAAAGFVGIDRATEKTSQIADPRLGAPPEKHMAAPWVEGGAVNPAWISRWLAAHDSGRDRPPGLVELNAAVLAMLTVWDHEVGTQATAREFGLTFDSVVTLVNLVRSSGGSRGLAAEPFPFVTIDVTALEATGRRYGAAGPRRSIERDIAIGHAERLRHLSTVQSLLVSCMGALGPVERGLPSVLFGSTPLEKNACEEAARNGLFWLSLPGRWIVATPLFRQRLAAREWGYAERFAAMTGLLRDALHA
jgi:hypothetical protein